MAGLSRAALRPSLHSPAPLRGGLAADIRPSTELVDLRSPALLEQRVEVAAGDVVRLAEALHGVGGGGRTGRWWAACWSAGWSATFFDLLLSLVPLWLRAFTRGAKSR